MRSLVIFVTLILCASSAFSTSDGVQSTRSKFVVVGVAGFRDDKAPEALNDSRNPTASFKDRPTGVWQHLSSFGKSDRILDRLYYQENSGSAAVQEIIQTVQSSEGTCDKDTGLIIFAFSWGVSLGVDMADEYLSKCGRKIDLFVVIDGVQKWSTLSFRDQISTARCLNYYQRDSWILGGDQIPDCENNHLQNLKLLDSGLFDLWESHLVMNDTVVLKAMDRASEILDFR